MKVLAAVVGDRKITHCSYHQVSDCLSFEDLVRREFKQFGLVAVAPQKLFLIDRCFVFTMTCLMISDPPFDIISTFRLLFF